MKKTKIICSIGPASANTNVMCDMVKSGMNVARINFSHATYEANEKTLAVIDEVRKITGENIAVLYDTKGPDFRCGLIEGEMNLIQDNLVKIVKEDVVGRDNYFTVNYKDALDKINVGDFILLDDGLMRLKVENKDVESLTCRVIDGGVLTSKKGISVPGVNLSLPFLSEQDVKDILYAIEKNGDFLALSFVESKENVLAVRKILDEHKSRMKIISKIESSTALTNLDDIIEVSDGIMVARGDLGVETPVETLPLIQKELIKKCRDQEKFVIVATEMLASMYTSPRPTRAEVTDISNAVLDGADAVMLSGETTVGKHPIQAVRYMNNICIESEKYDEYARKYENKMINDVTEAVASAVLASSKMLDAKGIIVPTSGGHSAAVISNLRPKSIILALCPNETVSRSLALNYGVYAVVLPTLENDMDDVVEKCKNEAIKTLNLNKNDIIIITGGIHKDKEIKQTNFMKIEEI